MKRPLLLIAVILLAGGAGVYVLHTSDAPEAVQPAPTREPVAMQAPARGGVVTEASPVAVVPRWSRTVPPPAPAATAPAAAGDPVVTEPAVVPMAVGPTSPARDRSVAPVRAGAAQITPRPDDDATRGEARLEASLGSLTKSERLAFAAAHDRARTQPRTERVPGETALRANLVKAECTAPGATARYQSLAEPARTDMRRRCARFDVTFAP